jgi:hypothetical protein
VATAYVVLRQIESPADDGEGGVAWEPIAHAVEALDDTRAIRVATEKMSAEERSGTFVAVPIRSFRPRSRTVETREIDRWA